MFRKWLKTLGAVPSFFKEEVLIENKEMQEESPENESIEEQLVSEAVEPEVLQEETKTDKFEQEAKENHDRYLRTLADFENYKKRTQKEKTELAKFANERILEEILPVIDNLERALVHSKETQDFDKMLEGLAMVQKQFLSVLDKFGVRPIECLNQAFDPSFHQSVGQSEIAADSDVAEGSVVSEAQKGYFLKERVLRPSLVIVAKKAEPTSTEAPDEVPEMPEDEAEKA